MSITSEIEERMGLKIEQLNAVEKETYYKMLDTVKQAEMTPEKLKDYIATMRDAVARDIVKEPTFIRIFLWKVENPNLVRLQARLQNYLLLEAFLNSPIRAKEQLEQMISNIPEGR